MSDIATASVAPAPLSMMHVVHLPGALGGLELHSTANVHLADRELFDAIADRYGATVKHFEGGDDVAPFDSLHLTIEDQAVTVFSSAGQDSVNTTIRPVDAGIAELCTSGHFNLYAKSGPNYETIRGLLERDGHDLVEDVVDLDGRPSQLATSWREGPNDLIVYGPRGYLRDHSESVPA